MGNALYRLFGKEKHLERPEPQSRFKFWIKRLLCWFGSILMVMGGLMILCSLMPNDTLLNLSLITRSVLDEAY
jgi:hypothetical protein